MYPHTGEHDPVAVSRKWLIIFLIAAVLTFAIGVGAMAGYMASEQHWKGLITALVLLPLVPVLSYLLYRRTIFPYYRRLEDANLELHIKQEELLDTKDDLFIKFLGIYDVNYAANSPHLFGQRLSDVADITTRVMEADRCLIFLYDKKRDELTLAAASNGMENKKGEVHVPLGEGIEGWVARRLEPLILKDLRKDSRFRDMPGLGLGGYQSAYCLPLYVYSNGALMGVIEVLNAKSKVFRDEEINFFTTLAGILSTTIQNEQMQSELRKMNMELEQWVMEKTEELRASEERYRKLVENAKESILVLTENGDIVFANDQAAALTGQGIYDLIHRNLSDLLSPPEGIGALMRGTGQAEGGRWKGDLRTAGGTTIPVEVITAGLSLLGKRFIQCVIHDISSLRTLERLLEEKDREISALKTGKKG